MGLCVPGVLPAAGPVSRRPLPSAGCPRTGLPPSTVLWGTPTPWRPSRLAPLVARRLPSRAPAFVSPSRPGAGLGPGALLSGSPHASMCRGGAPGRPKFPGDLVVPVPCSSTPAGPTHQAITVHRRGPRADKTEGSPRVGISGLNSTAWALAVYASQDGLPHRHARLASGHGPGLPGGIGYPQGCCERFPRCIRYIPSPFPELCSTQCQPATGRGGWHARSSATSHFVP